MDLTEFMKLLELMLKLNWLALQMLNITANSLFMKQASPMQVYGKPLKCP